MTDPFPHLSHLRERRVAAGRYLDRREGPRASVGYVRCGAPTPGVILDVSRKGLRIESFRRYRRGDTVLLTGELAGRSERIAGHVVWCRKIAIAGKDRSLVYHVGIALRETREERWLARLLEAESQESAARSGQAGRAGATSRRR